MNERKKDTMMNKEGILHTNENRAKRKKERKKKERKRKQDDLTEKVCVKIV